MGTAAIEISIAFFFPIFLLSYVITYWNGNLIFFPIIKFPLHGWHQNNNEKRFLFFLYHNFLLDSPILLHIHDTLSLDITFVIFKVRAFADVIEPEAFCLWTKPDPKSLKFWSYCVSRIIWTEKLFSVKYTCSYIYHIYTFIFIFIHLYNDSLTLNGENCGFNSIIWILIPSTLSMHIHNW